MNNNAASGFVRQIREIVRQMMEIGTRGVTGGYNRAVTNGTVVTITPINQEVHRIPAASPQVSRRSEVGNLEIETVLISTVNPAERNPTVPHLSHPSEGQDQESESAWISSKNQAGRTSTVSHVSHSSEGRNLETETAHIPAVNQADRNPTLPHTSNPSEDRNRESEAARISLVTQADRNPTLPHTSLSSEGRNLENETAHISAVNQADRNPTLPHASYRYQQREATILNQQMTWFKKLELEPECSVCKIHYDILVAKQNYLCATKCGHFYCSSHTTKTTCDICKKPIDEYRPINL